jgi:hypothetical protein
MTGVRGFGLVEALVGAALGALALGVLASAVAVGARALVLARGVGAQVVAVHDGIERLRHAPAGEVLETVGDGPAIDRRSAREDGRGRTDAFTVETSWAATMEPHRFAVATERAP